MSDIERITSFIVKINNYFHRGARGQFVDQEFLSRKFSNIKECIEYIKMLKSNEIEEIFLCKNIAVWAYKTSRMQRQNSNVEKFSIQSLCFDSQYDARDAFMRSLITDSLDIQYYRLDYHPEERGHFFSHPEHHIHIKIEGSPRVSWCNQSTCGFFEFLLTNHNISTFHEILQGLWKYENEPMNEEAGANMIDELVRKYNAGELSANSIENNDKKKIVYIKQLYHKWKKYKCSDYDLICKDECCHI